MLPILAAAALLGAIAPFVRSLAWGVPFGLLSIATVIRSFAGSALTTLVAGTVAFFALRTTPMQPQDVPRTAAAVGGLLAFGLLLSSARRMRHVRGLSILCQRLTEDDAREVALRSLRRLLDRTRKSDPQRHIGLVLMATGPLTQAGLWGDARDELSALEDAPLTQAQSVLRDQALATCELQFDDADAAERMIARIPRPTEPSIEVWLVAMEALLMAVRGESERALSHLGTQEAADNPSLIASHRLVHAHIYAARGDEDAAVEELRVLEKEAGPAGLRRVLRPRGPASVLAEGLLNESADQSG